MSIAADTRCTPEWLEMREDADAAARSVEALAPLRAYLAGMRPLVIRDLGCGIGAMGRWLCGRLPGPQHWILQDRDPVLLGRAAGSMTMPRHRPASVAAELGDVTGLRAGDLATTSLVTASALLDLLTADEVDGLAAACAGAGCAALLALSVAGTVELTPADPLDTEIQAAFNDHQRRTVGGRRLLGPDAPGVTAAAFERHGMVVRTYSSPWRLGGGELTAEWLTGWVQAASEQRPDLPVRDYLRRRLHACAAHELRVVVEHRDLLALPGG